MCGLLFWRVDVMLSYRKHGDIQLADQRRQDLFHPIFCRVLPRFPERRIIGAGFYLRPHRSPVVVARTPA